MFSVTSHQPLSIILPQLIIYTVTWSTLFITYQRYILPFLTSVAITANDTSTSTTSGSWSSSTIKWFDELIPSQKNLMFGRFLFSLHHLIVAIFGLFALIFDSPALIYSCMYHEISCDIFDVIQIFHSKGFTGLNWQGILLHHLLSIFAILTSLTLTLPVKLLAQLAILLDFTGSSDYFLSTILLHSPLIEKPGIFFLSCGFTGLFFISRLFYFPFLGYYFIIELNSFGFSSGLMGSLVIFLTCFFNVGMIKTRYRQYSKVFHALHSGDSKQIIPMPMESRERNEAEKEISRETMKNEKLDQLP